MGEQILAEGDGPRAVCGVAEAGAGTATVLGLPGEELVAEFDRLYVPKNDPRWLRRNALVAATESPQIPPEARTVTSRNPVVTSRPVSAPDIWITVNGISSKDEAKIGGITPEVLITESTTRRAAPANCSSRPPAPLPWRQRGRPWDRTHHG